MNKGGNEIKEAGVATGKYVLPLAFVFASFANPFLLAAAYGSYKLTTEDTSSAPGAAAPADAAPK